jgi:hypothetical protein
VEKQILRLASVDEPESLVGQLLDRAFGHCLRFSVVPGWTVARRHTIAGRPPSVDCQSVPASYVIMQTGF